VDIFTLTLSSALSVFINFIFVNFREMIFNMPVYASVTRRITKCIIQAMKKFWEVGSHKKKNNFVFGKLWSCASIKM